MHNGPDERPKAAVGVAASAGGVDALMHFVEGLPDDFEGVVLVVLHLSETGTSVLPHILSRWTPLEVVSAREDQPLRPGLVVVAPPGQHLRVRDGVAVLDRGPRENGHRPSADALFRSVAETFGDRSAGVILSGTMDDGAMGMRAIGLAGGFQVVQDPEEAAFPGMPRAAIAEAPASMVCHVGEIGTALSKWMETLHPIQQVLDPPSAPTVLGAQAEEAGGTEMSEISEFTCPDCGGTLWLVDSYGTERYRCRVGHSFSDTALLLGKQDALESALWAGVVALEERADLSRRMLKRLEGTGRTSQLQRYRDEIDLSDQRIDMLRDLINELVRRGVLTDVSENGSDGNGEESTD